MFVLERVFMFVLVRTLCSLVRVFVFVLVRSLCSFL